MTMYAKQNVYAGIILILSFFAVLLVSPKINYEPRGIGYPVSKGPTNQAVEYKKVQLFQTRPYGSALVGRITAELSIEADFNNNRDAAIEYARKLVGKLGGNGLVLHYFDVTKDVLYLEGDAIKI